MIETSHHNLRKLDAGMTAVAVLLILIPLIRVLRGLALDTGYFYVFLAVQIYLSSLWYFLGKPSYLIKWHRMLPLSETHEKYAFIAGIVSRYWHKKISILSFDDVGISGQSFGTWRKQYIAVSSGALAKLNNKELEALLLHEIHHTVTGDNWKTSIPRAVLLSSVLVEGILLLLGTPIWLNAQGETFLTTILLWSISLLSIVLASMGVLYIYRLREFLADNFVLQEMGEGLSLASLFAEIDSPQNRGASKAISKLMPQNPLFAFHPSGNARLTILNDPSKFIQTEYRNLAAYIGMLLANAVAYSGDLKLAMNFTLPAYLVLGSLFMFFLSLNQTGFSKKIRGILHTAGIIYTSALSAGTTALLLTLPWGVFAILPTTFKVGTMDFSPNGFMSKHEVIYIAHMLLDNIIVLLLAGSGMIVFISILQIPSRRSSPNLLAFLFWLVWAPPAITLSTLWIKYLGNYDVALTSNLVLISFGVSWTLALLLFINQHLRNRKRISINDQKL